MYIFLFLLLFLFLFLFYFKRKNKIKIKLSINQWMSMSKYHRNKYDESHKTYVLDRKNKLISQSRKEYLNYKKSKLK